MATIDEKKALLQELVDTFHMNKDRYKSQQYNEANTRLDAQKKIRTVKLDADKALYEQQITLLDKRIDALVFDLYGLHEGERKMVMRG